MNSRRSQASVESVFEPVAARTIKAQVAHAIRKAILTGRLRPGDHIPEATIAEQMAVSRAPVREALNQLKEQGLVVIKPHRGAFIRELRPDDVRDLIRLRAELEGYLGESIIDAGVDESLLGTLESHLDGMTEAAAREDFLGLVEHDEAFHQAMLHASGDGALIDVMQGIGFRIRTYMVVTKLVTTHLVEAAHDHRIIIDTMRKAQRDRIREVMWDHVTKYLQVLEMGDVRGVDDA